MLNCSNRRGICAGWIEHQFNLKGGKEVLKKAILSLAAAFTDGKYTLTNYAVNGGIVWVHYTFSGRHTFRKTIVRKVILQMIDMLLKFGIDII